MFILFRLGAIPDIDTLFPHRPRPTRRLPPEETFPKSSFPIATGAAFFTPDSGHSGNLFRPWDASAAPLPSRLGLPGHPESLCVYPHMVDPYLFVFLPYCRTTTYPTPSEPQMHRAASKSQPTANPLPQPHVSRPLSSAEETGPVPKKMRPTRQTETSRTSKATKQNGDDLQKKARDRQGFQFSNFFSSSARHSQQSSRSVAPGRLGNSSNVANLAGRRSTRLLSGTGPKQGLKVKLLGIPIGVLS